MKRTLSYIIFLISITCGNVLFDAQAQNAVSINPFSQSILIGEPVRVDINVNTSSSNVIFPLFSDTITTQIEVLQVGEIDTLFEQVDGKNTHIGYRQQITITSFDSGLWAFPELAINIDSITYTTDAFLFEVNTVQVDTSAAMAPIVDPIEIPLTFKEIMVIAGKIALVIWAVLLLIALVVYFLGKNPKAKELLPAKPQIPPHVRALERLDQLKSEELWQKGAIKAYHIQVSDIMKEYIENKFQVSAQESTTNEIKHLLKSCKISKSLRLEIVEALKISDLAKFAKASPLPRENEKCLETAYHLVNSTIVEPQENKDHVE